MHHFTGRNSVVVLFAWPTAENFLRYSRDMITAFGAAPHLAELIELLAQETDAENIHVFTYSAGRTVGTTLWRSISRDPERPDASTFQIGEVYHAAPDADFQTFVHDMRHYTDDVRRITVAVNMNDSRSLSQVVNRASRAGRPDMRELEPEVHRLAASRGYGLRPRSATGAA